jgi:UDP-N-acetylglucosamine--N-acetylmuramyl-(pentapeptide) pyrophosphoryl-undecaprenol N-acetylglucosamine transferase
VPQNGFVFEPIVSHGLKGVGPLKLLLGLWTLPRSLWTAFQLLRRYRPDVVVGVGGYSSGPVVLAATLLRIPTAVQEQNALAGLTNRLLGNVVDACFISFNEARRFFPEDTVHLLGNPIRRTLLENFLRPGHQHERFTLLVFGGSLGAHGLNSKVLEALPLLQDLTGQLAFVHQTGRADVEQVRQGYRALGFQAEVTEFIEDMSQAYLAADLVICRAGATTLAELTVCKKASILVPFPRATDDHQTVNARALVTAGAARTFRESELTGLHLAETIRELKAHPERLASMEKASGMLGRPEAGREIADVLQRISQRRWGSLMGQKRSGPPLRPPPAPRELT